MKIIIVKNYDTGEELFRFKTAKMKNMFSHLDYLLSKETDPLHLGLEGDYSVQCGITSFSEQDLIMSNDPHVLNGSEDICHNGPYSSALGKGNSKYQKPPKPVVIHTETGEQQLELRLAVTAYPEGYVLNTGKMSTNFLGVRKQAYLASIGRRNFRSSFISGAHIFPSINSLVNYAKKHERDLEYMVKAYGYSFSVEPCCSLFASSLEEIREKDRRCLPELEALLERINAADAEENEDNEGEEVLTGTASAEEMKEEAVRRLRSLRVMEKPVVKDFIQSGKIYRSEAGGILYDMDENSRKALSVFKQKWDYLPYAVIVSYTEVGTMYTILFVSPDKEKWPGERPDSKDGFCYAYVYNTDTPIFSALGGVGIEGANGGLVRIA